MKVKAQSPMRCRNATHGFTLMELVMIIMILGVLAAMTIPRMLDRKDIQKHIAFLQVTGDLRYAVDYAISSGHAVRIEFQDSGSGNRVRIYERTTSGSWEFLKRPATGEIFDLALDDMGLVLSQVNLGGGQELIINSLGVPLDSGLTPLSGAPGELVFEERRLWITPMTGLIQAGE